MAKRKLATEIKPKKHFRTLKDSSQRDVGTREMGLYPFVISGGKNTEHFYFKHISEITDYKFIIKPEYFGGESNYTKVFPKRITKILDRNNNAKIFCVFDWDTVRGNKKNLEKHEAFVNQFKNEIDNGTVVVCPSMPCIEYWFLLHFNNSTRLVGTCEEISKVLKPYMKAYFPSKNINMFEVLKDKDCLEKKTWVEKLCADGKLDAAIKRAEDNINAAKNAGELDNQSYSYVYKVFKNVK